MGDRFIIGYRMSGDEHVEGGLNLDESVKVAISLEKAGIDFVHLSSGCYEALKWLFPDQEGVMLPESKTFKAALNIPVICPNIHDPRTAERALDEGLADMISLSRALIADPEWPQKVQEGRFDDITSCVFCYTCVKAILVENIPVRCSQNPEVGWERYLPKYFPDPSSREK